MSADTLRYYEKIGLLPRVARNGSGVRRYDRADLARLKFIQRARLMNFSLDEIRNLLQFRSDPSGSKAQVRELTRRKLDDIGARVDALQALRQELDLLMDSCTGSGKSCPIIDGIEDGLREDAG
jgi:DNA-binding transcriptional MerR regulator